MERAKRKMYDWEEEGRLHWSMQRWKLKTLNWLKLNAFAQALKVLEVVVAWELLN